MNVTLWNSTEEASIHFLFGIVSIIIHAYALIICSAIFDYQNEKHKEEKSSFDVLIKDQMSTAVHWKFCGILLWNNTTYFTFHSCVEL